MERFIVFAFLLLRMLMPLEGSTYSTRVEYKVVNTVNQGHRNQLKPFESIGEKFYLIENDNINWFQAAQGCRRKGGNLVSLANDTELILVGLKLDQARTYWLDFNTLGQDYYVSMATGLSTTYVKWLNEPPCPKGNENYCAKSEKLDCATLVNNFEGGFSMQRTSCMSKASYICQLTSPLTISLLVW